MAWLATDDDKREWIYNSEPYRDDDEWNEDDYYIELPKGTIKKLIGKDLTWDDEPIEIK